jgi:hypothetical protein
MPVSQNGERLVVNIADDVRPRLQHDTSTLNRALDRTVHDHPVGSNRTRHMCFARDNERI